VHFWWWCLWGWGDVLEKGELLWLDRLKQQMGYCCI
jgi:hypothetical protein